MRLSALMVFSIISSAYAEFEIDEKIYEEKTIKSCLLNYRYELGSQPNAYGIPSLKFNQEESLNGIFVNETNLTFEEYCVKIDTSLKNNEIIDWIGEDLYCTTSKDIIHFRNKDLFQINTGVLISEREIIIQSNHIQINAYFKTPHSVIFKSFSPQKNINQFTLTPKQFYLETFGQSSSLYAAVDIDFENDSYQINWQAANSLTIQEKWLQKTSNNGDLEQIAGLEQIPSGSPKKRQKTTLEEQI